MAALIHHADGIVRDGPALPAFNEYPKCMTHPGYHPGDIGTEVKSPAGYSHYVGGTPVRFPPVLVSTADDEEYYAAKGYISQGKSDPAAFARMAQAARPVVSDYQPVEYPKWAGGVLVNSAEEEEAALAQRRDQLALPPADLPGGDVTPPPPAQPAIMPLAVDQRLSTMEAQIAQMREMMALMLAQQPRPLAPVVEEPEPTTEQPLTAHEKGVITRKRNVAAKAAALAARKTSSDAA